VWLSWDIGTNERAVLRRCAPVCHAHSFLQTGQLRKRSGKRADYALLSRLRSRMLSAAARLARGRGDPMLEAKQPNDHTIRRTNPRIADVLVHIEPARPVLAAT
jgi:hypothetical protein